MSILSPCKKNKRVSWPHTGAVAEVRMFCKYNVRLVLEYALDYANLLKERNQNVFNNLRSNKSCTGKWYANSQ